MYSMTAYASRDTQLFNGILHWEIRSVNHRYLELSIKLPEWLRSLEFMFRDLARGYLTRGKVDCFLKYEVAETAHPEFQLNLNLVDELILASQKVSDRFPVESKNSSEGFSPMSPFDILRWPSVILQKGADLSKLQDPLINSFKSALEDLIVSRSREGKVLKGFIEVRLEKIKKILVEVKTRLPEIKNVKRKKFQEKLDELRLTVDENRFEQEMVYFLQKMDISEELDRLESHIEEVTRILQKEKIMGRRLDFLMQEFNRETNTIASKTVDIETSQNSIELKVLIEEMREQIQNIE